MTGHARGQNLHNHLIIKVTIAHIEEAFIAADLHCYYLDYIKELLLLNNADNKNCVEDILTNKSASLVMLIYLNMSLKLSSMTKFITDNGYNKNKAILDVIETINDKYQFIEISQIWRSFYKRKKNNVVYTKT